MNKYSYELLFIQLRVDKNEKRPNKNLPPLLHQPSKPHKARRTRTINEPTHERKRTRHSTRTRTKHDIPQPQTPPQMQPDKHRKTRQKTHLHHQPTNPKTHF